MEIINALSAAIEAIVERKVQERIAAIVPQAAPAQSSEDLIKLQQAVDFLTRKVQELEGRVDAVGEPDIEYDTLADSINYDRLASRINTSDIVEHLDMSDVINYSDLAYEIDYSDLYSEIDLSELATEVDMDDLASHINTASNTDDLVKDVTTQVLQQISGALMRFHNASEETFTAVEQAA